MMPFCEYYKCKKVAKHLHTGILRKWESYDFRLRANHVQDIALCEKHFKKINKILQIRKDMDETNL